MLRTSKWLLALLLLLLLLHRVDQHALRPTERPNGSQTPFANPVVNCSPRNADKLSSLVDGDASPELRLKTTSFVT